MASKKTKFTVGLFVACGICIALLAILWLGMSHFLEKGQHYATYFDESVQGLDIDSPVKYRGVSIGRVDKIGVAPDSRLIEVILKVESDYRLGSDLVASLKSVGITGIMFVELDRKKKEDPDRSPQLNFTPDYPVIASKPSDISELFRGVDDVLNQIRLIDLPGISDRIKLAVDNINQMIYDANVKGIAERVEMSLDSANRILDEKRWDRILTGMEEASQSFDTVMSKMEGVVADDEEAIKTAIAGFKRAMENANTLLEKGTSLVGGADNLHSQLGRRLLVIARNLEQASDNLNRLIEAIAEQPSQLVLGQPPPPRKVE